MEAGLLHCGLPKRGPPGPTGARESLLAAGIPCIIITDDITTKKEEFEKIKASKFGYIIMKADAMIGARREFLDPIEMADYNGNLVKVLAGTGAFRNSRWSSTRSSTR